MKSFVNAQDAPMVHATRTNSYKMNPTYRIFCLQLKVRHQMSQGCNVALFKSAGEMV